MALNRFHLRSMRSIECVQATSRADCLADMDWKSPAAPHAMQKTLTQTA